MATHPSSSLASMVAADASPDDNNVQPMSIRQQMEHDGKAISVASTGEFLMTVGVMVPIWATFVLPLSLVYQVGRTLFQKVVPPKPFVPQSPFDSGYRVQAADILPRSQRTYDIVVLGATGFVGKLVCRHLAKTYGVGGEASSSSSSNGGGVKWAMAGRSQAKLDQVKAWLAKDLGLTEAALSNIDTILVDTAVPSTLPKLVRDTRVVVTTAGPFWQYGSTVVEFCSKFGTHYTDITGETSWVKAMMEHWQETAQATGAKIIPLAGHDSIPWDLSAAVLAETLKEEHDEELTTVTCFDELKAGISGGTFATLLLLLGGSSGPQGPTTDPFRNSLDGKRHAQPTTSEISVFLSKITKPWDKISTYGMPFLMSGVNFEVVSWTQALRGGGPLTYSEVVVNPDFKTAFVSYFQLVLLLTSLFNPITKSLFCNFYLPKPGEGPTFDDMENNSFLTVTTLGTGHKGTTVEAAMYFPRDAGYLDTARMVAECGLCLALEEDSLPVKGGGFFSPGYGLGKTLLKRLTETGTFFQLAPIRK